MSDPQKPKSPLDAILDEEDAIFALPDPEAPPPIPPPTTQTTEPAIEPAAAPAPPPVAAAPEPTPSLPPTPPEPPPSTPVAAPAPLATAPPPPPVEPAPVEPDGSPWKAKREAERREKEALAELNAAREREAQLLRDLEASRRPPTPPAPPPAADLDTDPLLAVEDRIARMERDLAEQRQRNGQLEAAVQRQSRDTTLRTEADQFTREHPDFPQARDFYIQKQIEEAELTGELDTVAADIRQRVPGEVSKAARERGITEAALSRELAQAVLFEQRLALMERTAAQRGKSVVETVYELARVRGFTGAPRAVTPTVVPSNGAPPPAAASAAETLRREQAQAAASSLATMPTSPSVTTTPGSLTYSGFLAMDAATQSRTMDQLDRAAQYGLVPSNWVEELQAGRPVAVPDAAQLEQRVKESTGAVPF